MATRAVPAPLAQLPNALTIARLALIPVFVALMLSAEGGHSWAAGIVFGIAAITDQIDGYLARRWRVESEFGKVADPLADTFKLVQVNHTMDFALLGLVLLIAAMFVSAVGSGLTLRRFLRV